MINRLVFDTTDVDTIAASSNVGAFLRSADGTLLTSTDVGGKQALDVRIAEGINVEVDLTFAEDSVNVSGSDVTVSNTVTVSATDLDTRDLNSATDSVTVLATDLDIRDLAFATDKVDVTGSSVTVNDAALANTAIKQTSATITTVASLFAAPLASRKYALIFNNGNRTVYVGTTGVTALDGFPIFPGGLLQLRAGAAVGIQAVADSGSQNMRLLELS